LLNREEDKTGFAGLPQNVKNDLKELMTAQLKNIQANLEAFEKDFGHSIHDKIPFLVNLDQNRVPGSRHLLKEGDQYLS
jgi:hypothetical protein